MKNIYLAIILPLLLLLSVLPTKGQSWVWAKQGIGSNGKNNEGEDVVVDKAGNIYFTGYFPDTVVAGTDTFKTGHSIYGCYLLKYDKNGNILWGRQSSGSTSIYSEQFSNSVAVDEFDNVYITGYFEDTAYFGANQLIGNSNRAAQVFLVKYDSTGNVIWARQGNGQGEGNSVAVDGQNNVYITGQFRDSITFNSYHLYGISYFITKYDPNGNLLWANAPAHGINAMGYSVAADAIGNAYIAGLFSDTLHLGRDTITTNGSDESFIVKYNLAGNAVWAHQSLGASDASGYSVTLDMAGNVYTTGYYYGNVKFDTTSLTYYSTRNIFLTKYDSSGKFKWVDGSVKLDNSEWYGFALTSDKYCNIYLLVGSINNRTPDVQFGGKTFSLSYGSDPSLLVECDSSGKALCGSIIGYGGDDLSRLAADPNGDYIYWGGDMDDTVTFGPDKIGPLKVPAEWIFVAKWQPCTSNTASGIIDVTYAGGMNVFPNPFHNTTSVVVSSEGKHYLELYDLTGRELQTVEFTGTQYELSAQGLAQGMYFIRVLDGTNTIIGTSKIVVQ